MAGGGGGVGVVETGPVRRPGGSEDNSVVAPHFAYAGTRTPQMQDARQIDKPVLVAVGGLRNRFYE